MKNVYDVIRQKEMEIERVKKELQALRIVAPLLEEELTEPEVRAAATPIRTYPTGQTVQTRTAVGADTKPIWP